MRTGEGKLGAWREKKDDNDATKWPDTTKEDG